MSNQNNEPNPATSPTIRSPSHRIVYSNAFGVRASHTDTIIVFGVRAPMPGVPVDVTQEEVSVVMTLSSVKILAESLTKLIKGVEKELGPISIPKAARAFNIEPILSKLKKSDLVE